MSSRSTMSSFMLRKQARRSSARGDQKLIIITLSELDSIPWWNPDDDQVNSRTNNENSHVILLAALALPSEAFNSLFMASNIIELIWYTPELNADIFLYYRLHGMLRYFMILDHRDSYSLRTTDKVNLKISVSLSCLELFFSSTRDGALHQHSSSWTMCGDVAANESRHCAENCVIKKFIACEEIYNLEVFNVLYFRSGAISYNFSYIV